MATIEHKVIGDSEEFTFAIGKYAFVSCQYIPEDYLESFLGCCSEKDKEIISKYINKKNNETNRNKL